MVQVQEQIENRPLAANRTWAIGFQGRKKDKGENKKGATPKHSNRKLKIQVGNAGEFKNKRKIKPTKLIQLNPYLYFVFSDDTKHINIKRHLIGRGQDFCIILFGRNYHRGYHLQNQ